MSVTQKLDFDDRVRLLTVLFNRLDNPPTKTEVLDIVSCIDMEDIIEYMADVGININHTALTLTLIQSTINEDGEWIDRKIQTLLDHFLSKI